jgi:outer membrane receptor for monomeric catechols
VDGVAGRNQLKTVGDIIKVDNSSIINYANAYAQLIYNRDPFNAYISVNGNNNWYTRVDRFNYVEDQESETISRPGFDIRAGLSYNPSVQHAIYLNGAIISRAPYFKFVFGNFNNTPVINLENEQIKTIEAGYRFNNPTWNVQLNAFYTLWGNVSLLSDEYVQLEDNLQTRAMINGLNARHMGIEAEVKANVHRNVRLGGFLLLGDYRWTNNVEARLFNNDNVVVDTVHVFAEDLFVGGNAQQQVGIFGDFRVLSFFNIRAEWIYNDKMFANFSPTTRRDPTDKTQPFQIPSYHNLNIYLGIPFKLFKSYGLVQINAYNLLDNHYIEWGEDGINHDLETFRGFWSFGRNFDFMIKLNF